MDDLHCEIMGKRVLAGVFLTIIMIAGISSRLEASEFLQQSARVSGLVYDGLTSEPLPGATVIYGQGRGTITDGEGRYRFQVVPGEIRVTFQYVGYRTESRQLMLSSGDTVELDISLLPQATQIDQVVISAGRAEQRLAELTVSMSIIKPEIVASGHITDAQELMNRSSGIEVLDGQASIRGGSGYSYGAGSRVMVLIDGLPVLSADAGHIRWKSLPFENLSQIEIIKGASSVMYGSSALNGIINFRTADATSKGVTQFFTEAGMFGRPKRHEWVWWDTPRAFSSTSITHSKRYGNTDFLAGAFVMYDNGYRKLNEDNLIRLNLGLKHRCTKVKGLTYGLAVNSMHNRKHDFILWENAEKGALKQDTSTAQKLHGTSITIDPVVSYRHGGRFNHDIRSRFQFTQNFYPEDGQNNSDALSFYSEYQFRFTASSMLSLNAGLMQNSGRIESPFYGDHSSLNASGYLQADITPFNRLKLVAGMRLEHNMLDEVRDDLVPLFRAGANYRLLNLTFLRASFGQGYRYPSIAEKHASTTLGAVRIFPNSLIKSESGWNSEIGVKQGILAGKLNGMVDLAIFYSQNKDMIEYVFGIYPDPATNVFGLGFKSRNIEFSRVYGFEIEFMMNRKSDLLEYTLNGGYVYMYPVEFDPITNKSTGTYLKFRRKHSFNINLITGYGKIDVGLHAFAKSRILEIDDVFLNPMTREDILPGFYDYWTENNEGHFFMDASVSYRLGSHYRISVALKNLTNTEYLGRPGDIRPHRHLSVRFSGTF